MYPARSKYVLAVPGGIPSWDDLKRSLSTIEPEASSASIRRRELSRRISEVAMMIVSFLLATERPTGNSPAPRRATRAQGTSAPPGPRAESTSSLDRPRTHSPTIALISLRCRARPRWVRKRSSPERSGRPIAWQSRRKSLLLAVAITSQPSLASKAS